MIAAEYGWSIEQFLELTMRQLVAFMHAIHKRRTTEKYYDMKFAADLKGAELSVSLESLLGVGSSEPQFDPQVDKALTEFAKARMEERKAQRNV